MNRPYIPFSVAAGFLALCCLPDAKAERAPNDEALRDVSQVTERSAEDEFGLNPEPRDQARSGAPDKKELMELTATVVNFTIVAGKLTVSLDNGQVWRQKYTGSFQIRVGDQVTIKKGRFGGGYSYFRRGRRIPVRRIQ